MSDIRKKPEILAPAGSIESLKGAVAAGALGVIEVAVAEILAVYEGVQLNTGPMDS